MDTASGSELEVPQMPQDVIGVAGVVRDAGLLFSPDGERLAITFGSANQNTDIWVLDIKAQVISRLTHSSTAGIPSEVFRQPELIRYCTFDGRLIPAFVLKPDTAPGQRSPAIVWVHGGPESQSRPVWKAEVQYFASLGYAVFVPNVRGSTGYGREYAHLDDVRRRMDSVKDLACGVQWLKSQCWVDPDRVAVQGGSYGGFMVLSSITTYPELFAAAIDFFGIGNFETFLLNTSPYRRKHREAEYGSLENDLEFLREISPAHHVDRIRCPLLVIQGRKDPRVPFSESENMVERIRARGGVVESIYFEDEGHGIVRPQNKIVSWGGMADFLDRHMPKK
jgi:dipeptidyl aminopeptidase/acylaminoacyl peptidase